MAARSEFTKPVLLYLLLPYFSRSMGQLNIRENHLSPSRITCPRIDMRGETAVRLSEPNSITGNRIA
jgi:hypothetical protein